MKKIILLFLLLSVFTTLLNSCKKDVEELPTADVENIVCYYNVTFQINWNSQDFPTDYPNNDHFSKLIGWSHKPNNTFFKVGTISSQGIEDMAELGATTPLDNELATKIANNEGLAYYIGDNLSSGVGTISQTIEVTKEFSAVTLVTMLAPSPDWYLGVIDINLLEDGNFVTQKTIDGFIYDAGTDDGTTYSSPNSDSSPKQPISLFVNVPIGNGTIVAPAIATVTFTKL